MPTTQRREVHGFSHARVINDNTILENDNANVDFFYYFNLLCRKIPKIQNNWSINKLLNPGLEPWWSDAHEQNRQYEFSQIINMIIIVDKNHHPE